MRLAPPRLGEGPLPPRHGARGQGRGQRRARRVRGPASTATGANNPEIAKKIKHLKAKVRPSSIHVPKTKPVAPSKADPSDKGGPKGDPEWLVTAKSPGQPIHVRLR